MSKETSFVKNAEELAKQKMDAINPELSSKFKFLIKFLSQFPEACSKPRSKKMQNKVGQEEHIEYLARSFHESRLPRKPTPPTTVPDEVVSIVLNISFNIQPENLERIKEEHRFSMAAENIVGDLLERSAARGRSHRPCSCICRTSPLRSESAPGCPSGCSSTWLKAAQLGHHPELAHVAVEAHVLLSIIEVICPETSPAPFQ